MIKPIEKTIEINAPAARVWDVIVKDELNRQWFAEFSEGSHAQTDWKEGSDVAFIDNSTSGIYGRIVESNPFESIVIEYDGEIIKGKREPETEASKAIKGTREWYKLAEKDGKTTMHAYAEMHESYYDMMNEAWDRAAAKLKQLAESH